MALHYSAATFGPISQDQIVIVKAERQPEFLTDFPLRMAPQKI
jgi:hypothetical protein